MFGRRYLSTDETEETPAATSDAFAVADTVPTPAAAPSPTSREASLLSWYYSQFRPTRLYSQPRSVPLSRTPDLTVPGHGAIFNIRSLPEAWDAMSEILHQRVDCVGVDADGTERNLILTIGYTIPGSREARCFVFDFEGLTPPDIFPFRDCISLILTHPGIVKVFHNCAGDGKRIRSAVEIGDISPAEDLGEWIRHWGFATTQAGAHFKKFTAKVVTRTSFKVPGIDAAGKKIDPQIQTLFAPGVIMGRCENGTYAALNEVLSATGCPQNQRKPLIALAGNGGARKEAKLPGPSFGLSGIPRSPQWLEERGCDATMLVPARNAIETRVHALRRWAVQSSTAMTVNSDYAAPKA
ncbi:hypothetical protein H9P43_004250 [Blastocladiella emersonii ATCC 22665]|nr:hypothetical protein H9P43_004250 [Blastocladiella emersonii ATCC 22665]